LILSLSLSFFPRAKLSRETICARDDAVYELFERMAYYGIASNLVIYMTDKLHQGTVDASNNVTNWSGVVFLTPLLGAYVADAYLGRYWTFVIGSVVYFMVSARAGGIITLASI
jgi:dipeptide/tripeptide permease